MCKDKFADMVKRDEKDINEEWEKLPIKEKYDLLSRIIFDTQDLSKVGAAVKEMTENISEQIMQENDADWFDKVTLKRNANEINKKGVEFHKSASELRRTFERMQALYEEIGMLINRYM